MAKKILVTGGAGFIGSHLCDYLLEKGYYVRVLDSLDEQVHGENCLRPSYLSSHVELIKGDVRDPLAVETALQDIDIVFHLAARVGVGQSMYEIKDYVSVNNIGTSVLLEAIIKKPVKKLIVASSMSIYGEGLYKNSKGDVFPGWERNISDLKRGIWELIDENGQYAKPVPTHEGKVPALSSVYALSKYDQERLCLITGKAYSIPVVALRFFNVYGTRQALSNPYTGVLAIFASRYLNGKSPVVYEDGNQKRDFINVYDVVRACVLAAEKDEANGQVFNIGSGNSYSILEIASLLASSMNKHDMMPEINGRYRAGDIRHCFSDISKAEQLLGFRPEVSINDGLNDLSDWLKDQMAFDSFEMAGKELEKRGLTV
ncbi:MAG TPA: NAD-dependent epimerase/dehydratase family protein [Bacteroidales bacterium]|nr:NAD-dependent epimerase/dehydratase family protein [Bacteroidales bacterium]